MKMKSDAGLHIGTSGWSYDCWKGDFYPEKLAKTKYLDHYADHFTTVEMNSIFYQLPPAKVMPQFARAVPESFVFSVKANRHITHIKRLNHGREILPPFFARMDILGDKMGPVLLQLPPGWGFNRERLRSFVEALPADRRFVFEFHDASWFNEITYDLLASRNAALGIFHAGERISPLVTTADFVYIRLHNPKVKKGKKIPGLVETWMENFRDWSGSGKDIFCYFDQAGDDCAVTDAMDLREAITSAIGAGGEKEKILRTAMSARRQRVPAQQRELRATG